jgi:hypothetical protein
MIKIVIQYKNKEIQDYMMMKPNNIKDLFVRLKIQKKKRLALMKMKNYKNI